MWHKPKAYGYDFQGNIGPTSTHISTSSQGYF
jgi:hypothetical protein